MGASDDHAGIGSNIDTSHGLVMALQLILQCEIGAGSVVEFHHIVPSHSERLSISGEGVVCDWVVEEVVNFWARHNDE